NDLLFNLIGTTYGGDGASTFALPDLRGRIPIHQGNGFTLAETGGAEEITLTTPQIPAHAHPFLATTNSATSTPPGNQLPARTAAATITAYGTDNPLTSLHPNSLSPVGGSQPHTNFQPYRCVSFITTSSGAFPPPP